MAFTTATPSFPHLYKKPFSVEPPPPPQSIYIWQFINCCSERWPLDSLCLNLAPHTERMQKKPGPDSAQMGLFLLTPWGSVLCHFLWSQWGLCAGRLRKHQPPYMKVRTAMTINYSAMWWGNMDFTHLVATLQIPLSVRALFAWSKQDLFEFWHTRAHSAEHPLLREAQSWADSSALSQHTEGIAFTFSPSGKTLFSGPSVGLL